MTTFDVSVSHLYDFLSYNSLSVAATAGCQHCNHAIEHSYENHGDYSPMQNGK